MSFRDPSREARANWDALDDYQASQVIVWVAGHLSRHRDKFFEILGKDIVGVGNGYRETQVRRKGKPPGVRVHDQVVVKVFVKKKWSRESDSAYKAEDRVPASIQVRVPVPAPMPKRPSKKLLRSLWDPDIELKKQKGWPKWLEVALPTDVCLRRQATAQATPALHVGAAAPGEQDIQGTACTLVKVNGTAGTQPYLLGCIHVLMRALKSADAVPDPGAQPFTFVDDQKQILGTLIGASVFDNASLDSLDAAVVKLDEEGTAIATTAEYWRSPTSGARVAPTRWFRSRDHLHAFLEITNHPVRLYPARGGTITMDYRDTRYRQTVFYQGSGHAQATMYEVLRFDASPATLGGDSGSPVVAGNHGEFFVGMHIGRDDEGLSWVLPCYQLFARTAFPPPFAGKGLDLATDLIAH